MKGKFLLSILGEILKSSSDKKSSNEHMSSLVDTKKNWVVNARGSGKRRIGDRTVKPSTRWGRMGVVNFTPTLEEEEDNREAWRHAKWEAQMAVNEDLYKKERRKQKQAIAKLTRDGFIKKERRGIFLTKAGEEKLDKLSKSIFKQSLFNSDFKKKRKEKVIIFSFDIPEKCRAIRDLIRDFLKFLGYEMIHQSVWCGRTELPEKFIQFLHKFDADQYIKIFSIDNSGNLEIEKLKAEKSDNTSS